MTISDVLVPTAIFMVTVTVNIGGAVWAMDVWRRLPRAQITRVTESQVTARLEMMRGKAPPIVRDAAVLASCARRFEESLVDPARAPIPTERELAELASVRSTFLPRIYRAAMLMLELERGGVAPDEWWSRLSPYITGIEGASLAHHSRAYIDYWEGLYASLGVSPATAREAGRYRFVGFPHNALLQYTAARLERVEDACRNSGDTGAARSCRRTRLRLLRQWVLEPAPPGLRLLAADLLADTLERDGAVDAASESARLAGDLRAWRAAYREAAQGRADDYLGWEAQPVLCPDEYARVLIWLKLCTWLTGVSLGVGLLTLLVAWCWIVDRETRWPPVGKSVLAVVAVVLLVFLGWSTGDSHFQSDLRRVFEWGMPTTWYRTVLLGACVGAGWALIVGLAHRAPLGRRGWLARAGAATTVLWLLIGMSWGGAARMADDARADWETARRAAMDDEVAAVAGPEAERWLAALRIWDID